MRKPWLKKIYVFFSSILIFVMHLPFVFAKSKPGHAMKPATIRIETAGPGDSLSRITVKSKLEHTISSMYDSLRLNLMGLSQQAFEYAMKGFNCLVQSGKVTNDKIISIIDFSQPSSKKRLFVIDLDNYTVVFNTYVAHGVNSGKASANQFSNTPESNKSSLGFYETLHTYNGHNGYSLRLEGLESGINDNAGNRAIVMHGAAYVNEALIRSQGYIGRSWGCPAVPEKLHKPIIDKIKNGTCLFIYSPDKNYLDHSRILHPAGV
jgi:hypothetical protein